jgi:hypothetical protein
MRLLFVCSFLILTSCVSSVAHLGNLRGPELEKQTANGASLAFFRLSCNEPLFVANHLKGTPPRAGANFAVCVPPGRRSATFQQYETPSGSLIVWAVQPGLYQIATTPDPLSVPYGDIDGDICFEAMKGNTAGAWGDLSFQVNMQERSIGLDAADLQKAHTDEFRKMAGAYVIFGGVVKNCSRR